MNWIQQGDQAISRGDFVAAEKFFRFALTDSPQSVPAMRGLGYALFQCNMLSEALQLLETVVQLAPSDLLGRQLFGRLCLRLRAPDLAEVQFRRILKKIPLNISALSGLVDVHIARNDQKGAQQLVDRMLAVAPNSDVALTSASNLAEISGNFQKEEKILRHLVALAPNIPIHHYHLSRSLLRLGKFSEGWKAYENRFQGVVQLPQINAPRWDGSKDKAILLIAEQGLGDAIMFSRFVSRTSELVSNLVLACHEPLVELFARSFGISVVPFQEIQNVICDAYYPLNSLPDLLNVGGIVLANPRRYLTPDADAVLRWKKRIQSYGSTFNVGLVYRCSVAHSTESFPQKQRSCDPKLLKKLSNIDGIKIFSLQLDAIETEIAPDWVNLGREIANFDDTAAILENLDMTLTVDTAIAHLAGALGRPLLLMLPFSADWRWGCSGEDTGWYDQAHLFRQDSPGNWQDVVKRVHTRLQAEVGNNIRASNFNITDY